MQQFDDSKIEIAKAQTVLIYKVIEMCFNKIHYILWSFIRGNINDIVCCFRNVRLG